MPERYSSSPNSRRIPLRNLFTVYEDFGVTLNIYMIRNEVRALVTIDNRGVKMSLVNESGLRGFSREIVG